jgi:hypothetical protein
MMQSFAVVPAGKAKLEKRERVGFDASLRTNSKYDAKYLRATAVHTRTATWSPTVGEVKLVKVGPRTPKLGALLVELADKFNK